MVNLEGQMDGVQVDQNLSWSRLWSVERFELGGYLARFIVYCGFVLLGNINRSHCVIVVAEISRLCVQVIDRK